MAKKNEGTEVVEKVVMRPLADLVRNPKNPRKSDPQGLKDLCESIKRNPAYFNARPILLSDRTGELVIIAGERRSEAAAILEMTLVPTILMHGLTEEQEDEIMVRDNTHNGLWDAAKLKEISASWGVLKVAGWGIEKKMLRPDKENYSQNMVRPKISDFIYEPKGQKPIISDCVDTTEMDGVLERLKAVKGITKEERRVLEICAYRFARIDFSKMAEYYAQSGKAMQAAMEDNFLVLIDFNAARERGYIKMVEKLAELCNIEIEGEE